MEMFIYKAGVRAPGETLPDASIEPTDGDGNVRRSDVEAQIAYMIIYPWSGIKLGDKINWSQKLETGTWFGQSEVTDPGFPVRILVRPLFGSNSIKVFYSVNSADGKPVGSSGERHYDVV